MLDTWKEVAIVFTTSCEIMAKPVLVISLDLELGWGFILNPEHKVLRLLRDDPQCGREAIELLLDLFKRYDIPATWAVVGHLLLDKGEGRRWISKEMPQFKDGWLDWDLYSQICDLPLYSASDIINKILASRVNHEIGLHSFFHIPFSVCSHVVAKSEVELGATLARKWGITPQSFVFPGNHIGHVDILKDNGIRIYRGEDAGLHKETTTLIIRKVAGAIDKIIAPPVVTLRKNGVWEIPGSMYFSDPQMPFTLLPRAKIGLERTIRANKAFHIWLHPWNLLLQKGLLQALEMFLNTVWREVDRGKLKVMTMGDLVAEV